MSKNFYLGRTKMSFVIFFKNQENSSECSEDLFPELQSLENHFNPSRNMEANVKLICFGIIF